jgi:hypothetical protein
VPPLPSTSAIPDPPLSTTATPLLTTVPLASPPDNELLAADADGRANGGALQHFFWPRIRSGPEQARGLAKRYAAPELFSAVRSRHR